MVEIEHIQDIEKDQPAKSIAKEQKLKDPVDANTELKILKYLKLQSMINRLKIKKIIHLKIIF
jgi:hypothetical protein